MARLPHVPSKTGDILYETFYSGAIGGSLLALLFLLSDAVHGHALFTPSVLGSTLLLGAPLRATQSPGLESVAWFSVVHFALFGALGLIGSLLVRSMEARENRPMWVTLASSASWRPGSSSPCGRWCPACRRSSATRGSRGSIS